MKIMVINGPNLNMLGIREQAIYGTKSYDDLVNMIFSAAHERNIEVICNQSNHEGDIIDWIQEAYFHNFCGIIINAGGYTHTSVAIGDAIKAIAPMPVIEVHISDIDQREEFRHHSYLADHCLKQIKGHGFDGYIEAMDELIKNAGN